MDASNKFQVSPATDDQGGAQTHAHGYNGETLSAEDSLLLAAWLVRCADPTGGKQFAKVLKAVLAEDGQRAASLV